MPIPWTTFNYKCFWGRRVVLRCQFRKQLTPPKYSSRVDLRCQFRRPLGSTKCPDGAGRLAMPHSADGSFPVGHLEVSVDAISVDNLQLQVHLGEASCLTMPIP